MVPHGQPSHARPPKLGCLHHHRRRPTSHPPEPPLTLCGSTFTVDHGRAPRLHLPHVHRRYAHQPSLPPPILHPAHACPRQATPTPVGARHSGVDFTSLRRGWWRAEPAHELHRSSFKSRSAMISRPPRPFLVDPRHLRLCLPPPFRPPVCRQPARPVYPSDPATAAPASQASTPSPYDHCLTSRPSICRRSPPCTPPPFRSRTEHFLPPPTSSPSPPIQRPLRRHCHAVRRQLHARARPRPPRHDLPHLGRPSRRPPFTPFHRSIPTFTPSHSDFADTVARSTMPAGELACRRRRHHPPSGRHAIPPRTTEPLQTIFRRRHLRLHHHDGSCCSRLPSARIIGGDHSIILRRRIDPPFRHRRTTISHRTPADLHLSSNRPNLTPFGGQLRSYTAAPPSSSTLPPLPSACRATTTPPPPPTATRHNRPRTAAIRRTAPIKPAPSQPNRPAPPSSSQKYSTLYPQATPSMLPSETRPPSPPSPYSLPPLVLW